LWFWLGLAALTAFLSFAQKGGVGVGAPTLIEFIPVSPLSRIVYLLYGLPLAGAVLLSVAPPDKRQASGLLLLGMACLGVVATVLSITEAMSHIDLFGKACRSVPALRTAIGSSQPALGGMLGVVAYGALVVEAVWLAGRPSRMDLHTMSGRTS